MPELGTSMASPVVWTPAAPTPNHLHEEVQVMRDGAAPGTGPFALDLLADEGITALQGDASMPATDDENDDSDASTDPHACSQQSQSFFAATQGRPRIPTTSAGTSAPMPDFVGALATGGSTSGAGNCSGAQGNSADDVFASPFDDPGMDMDMDFADPGPGRAALHKGAGISDDNEEEGEGADGVGALLPPPTGTSTPPTSGGYAWLEVPSSAAPPTTTDAATTATAGPGFASPSSSGAAHTPALHGGGPWATTPTASKGADAPTSTAGLPASVSSNPEFQSQFAAILEALTSAGVNGSLAAAAGEMVRGSSPSMFSSWSGTSDPNDIGQQQQQLTAATTTTTAPGTSMAATGTGGYSSGVDDFDGINASELFGGSYPLSSSFGGTTANNSGNTMKAGDPLKQDSGNGKDSQHKQQQQQQQRQHTGRKTRPRGRSRGSKRDPRHKLRMLMQAMPRESVAKMRNMVGRLQPHALRPNSESPRFSIDYNAIEETVLQELLKAARKEPKLHKLSTSPRMGRRNASKVCDSCHTTKTPVWREADNRYFCNACGLRYHKLLFRCPNIACRYVPHHADLGKPCSRCGHLLPRSPTTSKHASKSPATAAKA